MLLWGLSSWKYGYSLRPVIISIIITPKLKISAFIEIIPWIKYSCAIYPLQYNIKVWDTASTNKEMQNSQGKDKVMQMQEESSP
jgi:hypothetical protein